MPPKAKTGKGRAPAKRKLAEEFPPGEVLTDTGKKAWKLGDPVGQGGFGLIYLADENSTKRVGVNAPFVIKVEPRDNGPLFSEQKFYMRAAKPELIQCWMKSHKLENLGVPRYWGSGVHERGGKSYRFMVMDRLGTDLQKKFESCGRRFPRKLVLQLGLRLLDILEYIHHHEYVHADIKASNIMLSHSDPNQVYLVDYGLAYRYAPDGILKIYKEDPKRCHDGTIEFTSIDAHKGAAACRRGDLEILGYCMVQWLCGRLPWEDKLHDPIYVRDSKIWYRDNIPELMKKCFSSQDRPDEIKKFMEEVKALDYQGNPPYSKLRKILQTGLNSASLEDDGKLDFSAVSEAGPSSQVMTKRKRVAEEPADTEDSDESPVKKKTRPGRVNGVEKSPKKRPGHSKISSATKRNTPKSTRVGAGTRNSSDPARKTRGRPKKRSP